uniref:Uncharacterized protein n=1 Tax=Haptolina ericina TaxID=156174 RepID=A0A7S3FFE6_9EUKA|mmetsp:Transcript_67747/g.151243  ORF Transcript_67747/g.151243 Transcript_67747/m.151243 type:complete len:308 (+) Transcript_67747:2-925(+)
MPAKHLCSTTRHPSFMKDADARIDEVGDAADTRMKMHEYAANTRVDDANMAATIDTIVQQEIEALVRLTPEEQEAALPTLLERVEERAIEEASAVAADDASGPSGYQFGDITKAVVNSTRAEVQRQLDSEWSADDVTLLLKVGVFLGAGAMAPVAGLAAMPAAALLATYGTVLKAELGVRAVQEVGLRLAERAAQGVADSVRDFTGKERYELGDLTTATVRKVTGNEEYELGDITRGAVQSFTGQEEYKFGDITKTAVKSVTGKDEYKFGDITKTLFRKFSGRGEEGSGRESAGGETGAERGGEGSR